MLGGRRLIRLLILFAVLSMGRRFFRGGSTGGALSIPGVDNTTLFVTLVVAVVVIGGLYILRDRLLNGETLLNRGSTTETDGNEEGAYTCRYCGENLQRYRNRCPRCETRNPVPYQEE
ncbi:hypothetical protein [Haladaptatus sp. NG-SE-30]